uniref:Uncharacterized protein n=1 Tax=Serinus canaria TaxID=9135 RepID=A0A8C9NQJ1_SERCA
SVPSIPPWPCSPPSPLCCQAQGTGSPCHPSTGSSCHPSTASSCHPIWQPVLGEMPSLGSSRYQPAHQKRN